MINNIEVSKILEKNVWENRLKQYDSRLLIESGSDDLSSFAIIETPNVVIGVSYEEDSIYPKVKQLNDTDVYFVGVDNRLLIIDTQLKKVTSQIDLQSFFVDVIEVGDKGIIVVEEIGVGLYKLHGERKWFVPTDLIENYFIESDCIIVNTENGKLMLSTTSGKKLA